jgi:type I restriction enzyme S subunit
VEPYRLRIGDLLFTRYNGSLEFVGVCGLIRTISVKGLVYPDKLIRVRVSKARVLPDWIEIAANSPQARDVIENKARTSAGQTGISGKDLKELLLPIPTLPEQQEIVRRVEDLFAFADRIEARLATAQKTVERLTPATLAKAFRGELVPQDPNDEPASVLLERLSTSTPNVPAKSRRMLKRRVAKP